MDHNTIIRFFQVERVKEASTRKRNYRGDADVVRRRERLRDVDMELGDLWNKRGIVDGRMRGELNARMNITLLCFGEKTARG